MRTSSWLLGVALALGLAGSVQAQSALTFGRPVGPLQFVPVNTQNSLVPISGPQFLSNSFSLANILPSFSTLGANSKPIQGQTIYPTGAQLPGSSYLKAFGFQRPVPIAP